MTGPALWPDEIPKWLVSRRMPSKTLVGPTEALLAYARAHGYPPPTLLELDAARRRRRALAARQEART